MTKIAQITSQDGEIIEIDISACGQFGFSHGQRVKVISKEKEAIVLGVAPFPEGVVLPRMSAGKPLLWVLMDKESGIVFVSNPTTDLENM